MADLTKQIVIAADASGVETGVGKAKQSLASLGAAAQTAGQQAAAGMDGIGASSGQASQKLDRDTKNMIGSIQRATAAADAGGKSTAKYFESIAIQRGISTDVLRPFIDQLKQAEQNAAEAGHGMEHLSFGTAAAKRELVVLTHELSQGNFKRFGGSLLVLAEQTGAAGVLFSGAALGVAALVAAVAGIGVAVAKGAGELKGFTDAAILSGNAIGVSATQFTQLRDSLASVAGSKHAAADVLIEIAKNGALAGSNIADIAAAAALMERATGQSVDKTIAQFAELAKSPAEASAKLNEQFNYLTASTYAQIKALEDQGRTQDAATLAERSYADAVTQRAQTVLDGAGTMTKAWHTVAEAAKSAWDAMLNIGREDSLGDKLNRAAANLDEQRARLQGNGQFGTTAGGAAFGNPRLLGRSGGARVQKDAGAAEQDYRDAFRRAEIEGSNAASLAQQAAQTKARIEFDKEGLQLLTKRQRMELEITKARNEGAAAGASPDEISKRIAQITEKYGKGDATAARKIDRAGLGLDIEKFKADSQALIGIYTSSERIIDGLRAAGALSDKEYFDAKRGFINLESDAKEDALRKEIARYQTEKSKGADALNDQKKIAAAESQLAIARADRAAKQQVLDEQQAQLARKQAADLLAARQAAQGAFDTTGRQQNMDLSGAGKGNQQRGLDNALFQITEKYGNQRRDLENQLAALTVQQGGRVTEDQKKQYQERLAIIDEFQQKSIGSYTAYYQKLLAQQSDFSLGAKEALKNYADETQDVFKATNDAVTSGFHGMEDALVTFVTTGKANFKGLVNSILADIARIVIRQQITGPLAKALGGAFGGSSGGGGGTVDAGSMDLFMTAHTGAIVGESGGSARHFNPGIFAGATKYHTGGLVGDEVPAVLKRGEGVFTPGQMRAMGGAGGGAIHIVNNTSGRIDNVSEQTASDGSRVLVFEEYMSRSLGNPNSKMSKAMTTHFGLKRPR